MDIKENISLKAYNTFGIDVCASKYAEISSEEDLQHLLACGILKECPFVILGGGSNIVFVKDFDGIVVHPTNKGISIISENDNEAVVEAAAGETWSNFAWTMTRRGYYGLENLVEIPGCVGAAPIQNVGAYGREAKDVIKYVVAYEIATGTKKTAIFFVMTVAASFTYSGFISLKNNAQNRNTMPSTLPGTNLPIIMLTNSPIK